MPVPEFATIADMEARFDQRRLVELTNQSGGAGIDAARMANALRRANNKVRGSIAAKYNLDAGVPDEAVEQLRDIACDFALYYLYRETPPDGVKDRFKTAETELRDLRDGLVKLDTGSQQMTARPEGVLVSAPDKIFGRDQMKGF